MDDETKKKILDTYKEAAKSRTFARPETADEAEGALPTLAQLASGGTKTYEERPDLKEYILRTEPVIDQLRLYFASTELGSYWGSESAQLSEEEKALLRTAIKKNSKMDEYKIAVKEYVTLQRFALRLSLSFKRFQASMGILAGSLNKWDQSEKTAEKLTAFFKDKDVAPKELKEIAKTFASDGISFSYDTKQWAFKVSVYGKGGLYEQIKQEAKEATEEMAAFKAYADVAEEYIEASLMKYTPIAVEMTISNAQEERYTRYLVNNLSFFRSELNDRKDRGETVTPEDEKRAVIPDFFEVKRKSEIYKDCKRGIKKLEDGKI